MFEIFVDQHVVLFKASEYSFRRSTYAFSNHDFLLRETAGNLKDNGYLFASTPYYDESQQYIANQQFLKNWRKAMCIHLL